MNRYQEAADPERYPGVWDDTIRAHIAEGLTDDEALGEIEDLSPARPWSAATRRVMLIRITALRRIAGRVEPVRTRPGPKPSTDEAAVLAKRRELEDDGKPSGEQSVADALGVSRSAVRYALGKDRRR